MDLFSYIKQLIDQHSIAEFAEGFSKSEYNPSTDVISSLVRNVFENSIKLEWPNQKTSKPVQIIYQQLQSGSLASGANGTISEKSPSFCSEFDQMITNIAGLISYEFSYYVMLIMGMKSYLRNIAKKIEHVSSWEELEDLIIIIDNGFSLGDEYGTFSIPSKIEIEKDIIRIDEDLIDCSRKQQFNDLLFKISRGKLSENQMRLKLEKTDIMNEVISLIDSIVIGQYRIDNIDQLCIMDVYPPNYSGSFIKLWEILYKESFVDYDINFVGTSRFKPYMHYADTRIRITQKINNCAIDVNTHFRHIFELTRVSMEQKNDLYSDGLVTCFISDEFYNQLTDVTLNLFVTLGSSMVKYQSLFARFGKSTRTQFMQILLSLGLGCMPRYSNLSESQLCVLHYILMESKSITKSIDIVMQSK